MKIVDVRTVHVAQPPAPESAAPQGLRQRRNADAAGVRAFPIHVYPQYSRTMNPILGRVLKEFWVQVVAEDGTWGLGHTVWGEPARTLIMQQYAPLIIGADCLATEFLNDAMWRAAQHHGDMGIAAVARSGVDLALWDLKGKLLEQPVYSLLGGPVRERLPLYCTTDDLDWAQELGFRHFKISNPAHHTDGREGLGRIAERVARARDQVGDAAELMFNPVMSFNVAYTLRVAEVLRAYGVRWLEEPLMPWDLDGMAELKRSITWLELATGEHHQGRHAFRQLLERRAVDVLQPDISLCGGLTEMMKIYHMAEAFGIVTIPHLGANSPYVQHAAMAMPESPMQEYYLRTDPGVPLRAVALPGVAVPQDGWLTPSDAPGFGLDIAPDSIRPITEPLT